MDKNTIIGLVLIGLILSVFTIVNQPSEEEVKVMEKKAKIELAEQKAKEKEAKVETEVTEPEQSSSLSSNWEVKLDEEGNPVPADSGMVVYTDFFS